MNQIVTWLKAARPQTMGLSLAVILAGSAQVGWLAFRWDILLLALFSAAGFQLISNFANDYGDFKKGTDAHRTESYRALSAGNLTERQVKSAIILLAVLSLLSVVILVWRSPVSVTGKWVMFALGIASVVAAMAYTLGKRPYGYYAMGDVMVFLFFGLVGVIGSYYLQGGALYRLAPWTVAVGFGALSTTVLNINNMRDSKKDQENGKITVANVLGHCARWYQMGLFALTVVAFLLYALVTAYGFWVFLAATGVVVGLWRQLQNAENHADYNRCLALTVILTFLLSILVMLVGLMT